MHALGRNLCYVLYQEQRWKKRKLRFTKTNTAEEHTTKPNKARIFPTIILG